MLNEIPDAAPSISVFNEDHYLLRRKVLSLMGAKFHIYDASGAVVLFSHQRAFKLKEDIVLFADESRSIELLRMRARSVIDFGATYDVVDTTTGEVVGSLRRKGLKSMLRDSWIINDASEQPIGTITEDSMAMAMIRRFASNLVPQKFIMKIGDETAAIFKQQFNPFIQKMTLDFSIENAKLDRRLGLAAGVLIMAIEGRQN